MCCLDEEALVVVEIWVLEMPESALQNEEDPRCGFR